MFHIWFSHKFSNFFSELQKGWTLNEVQDKLVTALIFSTIFWHKSRPWKCPPFFHCYFQGHFPWPRLGNAHTSSCAVDGKGQPWSSAQEHLHQCTCAWRRSVPFSIAQFPHLQEVNLATCIPLHKPHMNSQTPADSQEFLKQQPICGARP